MFNSTKREKTSRVRVRVGTFDRLAKFLDRFSWIPLGGRPVEWVVHIVDGDGIPLRSQPLDAKAVVRLVTDLNAGRYGRAKVSGN